jgi:hypothetical protein
VIKKTRNDLSRKKRKDANSCAEWWCDKALKNATTAEKRKNLFSFGGTFK